MASKDIENEERSYLAYDWEECCRTMMELHLPRFEEIPDIPLYMDQLIGFVGKQMAPFELPNEKPLTSSMVNNYVKMRLVPQPLAKRYQPIHVAYLIMVCLAKRMYSMTEIEQLIALEVQHRFQVPDAYNRFIELFEASLRTVFGTASGKGALDASKAQEIPGALGLIAADPQNLSELDRNYLVLVNSLASKIYIEQMLLSVAHRAASKAKQG